MGLALVRDNADAVSKTRGPSCTRKAFEIVMGGNGIVGTLLAGIYIPPRLDGISDVSQAPHD